MPADLLQAKHSLRQQAREKLAALAAGEIADMSERIVARILDQSDLLQPGSAISLFGGIKGEPDLSPLIAELVTQEISPVYFGFNNGELVPQIVTSTDQLIPGLFGALVPISDCPVIEPSALDVILTPGLAFDRQMMRLGRGKGHFDKLFAHCGDQAKRIGVCFECQIVDTVPAEPHDMNMHGLITEDHVFE